MAVGHCRYGTTGTQNRGNAQPMLVNHLKGGLALCHNGNLVNARELREELELKGAIFHTTSDTEVIAYIITQERLKCDSIEQAVLRAMERIEGAYSLVIMSPQKLIAAHHSVEEIARIIGVDSLGFLNVEHLPKLADHSTCGFCNGCFTGNYPVDPPRDTAKLKFERSLTERQQTEEGSL